MEKRGKSFRRLYREEQHNHASPHEHYHHHTHKLLYFITTLLIILILAIIISYPLYNQPSSIAPEGPQSLSLDSTTCAWKPLEKSYEICASISWEGTDALYVKPFIPGGEPLETVQKYYTKQFVYCQLAGIEDGYRVVRAMLFDGQTLLRDIGKGVSCEGKLPSPQQPLPLEKKAYVYSAKAQFFASMDTENFRSGESWREAWLQAFNKTTTQESSRSGRASAYGTYILQFPDVVESCTFDGTWITDDDPFGRQRQYCHDAMGSFHSYADAYTQYVTNDPGYFTWAGVSKPTVNPPATYYPGYVLFMNTCSNDYYRQPLYYMRAVADGFGTKDITLIWEYYDDETKPQVTFLFNATCTLQP